MADLVDILRTQGVNAKGYGTIPKIVMQDPRISQGAKLIYGYMCSFAGAGDTAFPGVAKICADLGFKTTETFRKHRRQLEQYGYLKVEQQRGANGYYKKNIYTICQFPEPYDDGNKVNPENKEFIPTSKNSATDKISAGEKRSRTNPTTKNNNNLKNNSNNKNNNRDVVVYSKKNSPDVVELAEKYGFEISGADWLIQELTKNVPEIDLEKLNKIFKTMRRAEDEGRVNNAIGVLRKNTSQQIKAILNGMWYATSPTSKTATHSSDSEYEIYVPPVW